MISAKYVGLFIKIKSRIREATSGGTLIDHVCELFSSGWHTVFNKCWILLYYYLPNFLHKLDRNQDAGEPWNGLKAPVCNFKD